MRTQFFFNEPSEPSTGDSTENSPNPDNPTDDPGRTDTDSIPKKKAE